MPTVGQKQVTNPFLTISKFIFREGEIRTFLFGRKLHREDYSHLKMFYLSVIRHIFKNLNLKKVFVLFLILWN